ncbi:MAG TPA: outer membrane protein assembly factor BamD [Chitinophagaceae bacterium]|jgi:outer membrane protein assembly factor BamD|nr:outer membrane protein assembly factor BamD [Chitinophagaceae bacterium]
MKFFTILLLSLSLISCNGINKVLKNKDPQYKLRMAEQYYASKKYVYAQQLYEDVMPYFKTGPEFEDIYYKYAYTAYYQRDYMNAENLFKTYLEIFPNSTRSEEMDYMRAYTFYKQSPKAELDQTNTIKTMGMMQTFINTHPGSARVKEATAIIDICRQKLETKEHKAAQLYYDLGQFRAAAVAFNTLLDGYPETAKGDEYKLMAIKSYFRFAELSVEEKKSERFEKVVAECNDFIDRFPQSGLEKEVQEYLNLSKTNLKKFSNEPTKTST